MKERGRWRERYEEEGKMEDGGRGMKERGRWRERYEGEGKMEGEV